MQVMGIGQFDEGDVTRERPSNGVENSNSKKKQKKKFDQFIK